MQGSGNHGRSSNDPPPTGIGSLVQNTTPQQSTRGFVAPSAAPVKKTPDITDIIVESRHATSQKTQNAEEEKSKNAEEQKTLPPVLTPMSSISTNGTESQKNFPEIWQAMFELVFSSVPTIYFPLKNIIPEIEYNILNLTVKNEIQKEHFEAKKREVLEYLRTHYSEQIENVVVRANEQMETKKIIYDIKDKLQNFKEQNVEFDDFLQILDLKIKD
ncbi:MAG: hypothetical protein LBI45_02205 [Bacteroidales bacterium]|jgi:TFIIF-interacting CTD phosphatase-like protein|nr:hypothetical protein [Bacteroidales bacterium]